MKFPIDKTTFTHEAGGRDLHVSDILGFLDELGEGSIYLNQSGVLVYLMDDGAFYAYHYLLQKGPDNLFYSKRIGFEGTKDAHARFLKATEGHAKSIDPEKNTKISEDYFERSKDQLSSLI